MNKSNNNIRDFTRSKLEILKNWLFRYSRIIMPIVLVICVAVTVTLAINANRRKEIEDETIEAAEDVDIADKLSSVPEVPLELNAVPEINELVNAYYAARVEGDIDTMKKLRHKLDETETLREQETSRHIESFPTLEIYTKTGLLENTYIVYIYYEVKFHDYEKALPGMTAFYACTDENGNYYLTKEEDVGEDVLEYLRELSLQDDVIDLNNRVAVAFNDMVAEDEELSDFIRALDAEIDKNVGEAMAKANGSSTSEEKPTDGEATGTVAETENKEPTNVVTKVKAKDVVNIRTSDSETADKLGKAAIGDEFTLLEERANGWSKVKFEGREAFIKSEYLEPSEFMEADAGDTNEESETQAEQTSQTDNGNSAATAGTVTVKENVRIRASASEDGEKLGTAYVGEQLEVIMKQADGWTKIKYNGKTAYVKSDYVE